MLSSKEADLIDAVTSTKTARSLRYVVWELGFTQKYPTPIYEGNDPNIDIVNSIIATERTLHIDVRLFDIQGWKESGDIIMHNIPGVINPTYDINKPLGWLLDSRHARYLMGYYNISFGLSRSIY